MTDMPGKVSPAERRIEPRVSARLYVHVSQDEGPPLSQYSVNLSTGGLFLESVNLLPEGTLLYLRFELPDSRMIFSRGRVAWGNRPDAPICHSLPPGMGIQFMDLQPEDLDALRCYIRGRRILPAW